jgi:hypothetical protein
MTKAKAFSDLIRAGKIDKARKMLEAETVKAEFEPDTITTETGGKVVFTRRGKEFEQDSEDNWRLKRHISKPSAA